LYNDSKLLENFILVLGCFRKKGVHYKICLKSFKDDYKNKIFTQNINDFCISSEDKHLKQNFEKKSINYLILGKYCSGFFQYVISDKVGITTEILWIIKYFAYHKYLMGYF